MPDLGGDRGDQVDLARAFGDERGDAAECRLLFDEPAQLVALALLADGVHAVMVGERSRCFHGAGVQPISARSSPVVAVVLVAAPAAVAVVRRHRRGSGEAAARRGASVSATTTDRPPVIAGVDISENAPGAAVRVKTARFGLRATRT